MLNPNNLVKNQNFNPSKCSDLIDDLTKVFQKHEPTVSEIIIAYGNLGYLLGASIGSYKEGPSLEKLESLYKENPQSLDVALMLQSMTVISWYENWENLQLSIQESRIEENKNE